MDLILDVNIQIYPVDLGKCGAQAIKEALGLWLLLLHCDIDALFR